MTRLLLLAILLAACGAPIQPDGCPKGYVRGPLDSCQPDKDAPSCDCAQVACIIGDVVMPQLVSCKSDVYVCPTGYRPFFNDVDCPQVKPAH